MNEPETATAAAANKGPWSLGLVFGSVLIIGTYAALFIPALSGRPITPQFGFGSIFWNALYFSFLWKRLGRKGRNGAIIGGIIGLLAFFVAVFVSSFVRASGGH